MATLLWCSGMIMCAIVFRNLYSGIFQLNAEISQFCQHLHGAVPPDPRIWNCLLGQTRTSPFKISVRACITYATYLNYCNIIVIVMFTICVLHVLYEFINSLQSLSNMT